MDITKIDRLIEEYSLLKHPFYQMWSDGKLTLESLAGYSKEYFHLVKSVPLFMDPIISQAPKHLVDELVANQQEEQDHIVPWISFAANLGVSEDELLSYTGTSETRQAVSDMTILMQTFESGAVAMYAFEKEIPKISQTKLDGLSTFYNITDKEATRYFELHTEADIRHAHSWQQIIQDIPSDDILDSAEKSLVSQNLLLDGCYQRYCL